MAAENPQHVISFVLGSYNRANFLKKTIASIRANNIQAPYEIIVVEGGSTDGALEWILTQKNVLTIVQHNRGAFLGNPLPRRSWGYFMNLGFKAAQGKYILMLSDDCLLLPNAVNAGVGRFEQLLTAGRKVGGLAFYFRDWPEQQEYGVQLTLGGKLFVNHGLFLRQAVQEIGWADEERYVFYKADGDLCLRMWSAGYEILDSPESFVEHHAHANVDVRQSNQGEVLTHDRTAYLERWKGIYYFPDQPDPRQRIPRQFADPARTADQFLTEEPLDKTLTSPTQDQPIPMPRKGRVSLMRQGRQRVFTPGGNLLRVAKQTVAKTVRRFGYELQRIKDAPAPQPDFWVWLRQSQQIRTVIDIGANVGEFAAFLFRYFQPNALYAFEPLPSCQSALQARAAVSPNFQVFPLALSDHAGRECFYENSYPPSSSLLRIGDISRQEFPQTSGESPCVVQVALLDSVLRAADLEKNIFIKIDVQGVEDRVIRGGRNVFAAASCVLIEMSFASMYDGQPLFEEVHVLLADLGLRFAGMKNQIAARSGQPLFAHCLYVRAEPQQ